MPHILNVLIWFPILAAIFLLAASDSKNPNVAKYLGLFTVIISLALCIPLLSQFDSSIDAMQFTETYAWLPSLGISYSLGIDGIALLLIVLSIFTTLVVLLATWNSISTKVPQYIAAFLLMQGLLVGVFAALDSMVFYIFWEATLIPMYLIIGIWGSANRIYAAIKFFLFTFLGSVTMLLAFLYLAFKAGSFQIEDLQNLKHLSMTAQSLIFLAFFLGFAIKIPMWPVHTWLPDAHTEAPAGGSIMLAAVLLKLGAYGFLRFALPIVPDASAHYAWVMVALSLVAVIYVGLVAVVQTDMKKLIAYSSISHMGFVTLGCFAIFAIAKDTGNIKDAALVLEGAIVVMVSHAFVSSGMFAGVGFIYDRMHTREIKDFGGLVNTMPMFASFMMLFAMGNAGLPGTSGFVGEFMVILGSMRSGFWIGFLAATTLVIGAVYTLWMYKRVIFGAIANEKVANLKDISGFEVAAFSLLGVMVLAMGIYPEPVLNLMHQSVNHLLKLSVISKL